MKERPILFNGEMVLAILGGRKTMTRRVVKPQPWVMHDQGIEHPAVLICPHGQPGSRLWVRETWGICPDYNEPRYRADRGMDADAVGGKWKPSIFMPRKYSRITLEITAVRVERLQDISVNDCMAEGIPENISGMNIVYDFRNLWDYLNAKRGYGWDTNPWVWVIEFKRIAPPAGEEE